MTIEININCDLGEKSKHHSNKHDPELLEIVNSANIACGYHAGDEETMNKVVEISKTNGVSIGAHPSFNDPENFGRERMNLSSSEIEKLIIDQYEILQSISSKHGENVTHIKPHGALNNMACEDIDLATTLAKVIKRINPELIYLVPTGSKMEHAAKKLDMKIACEIFADRNYEDDGNLVSRKKPHGALNNMACEDINLATILAKVIKSINPELIYLVPTGSKMEQAAKKLDMKIACEIFADRNYEDDGNLVSRKKPNALITDPELAKNHVLSMVKNQALNCHSGKQIPCEIDSVCIHGDNISSLNTAKAVKENLLNNGLKLIALNKMEKFKK